MRRVTASEYAHLAVGVAVLLAVALVVLRVARIPTGTAPLTAVLRGAAQLAVVAAVLRGALTRWWAVPLVLLVMLTVAVATSSRRLSGLAGAGRAVALAAVLGAGTALGVVFATGTLPFSTRYLVALGGIVIGATMTGATLTGRRLRGGLLDRWEEVEGWLALGATHRHAASRIARDAVREALVPGLDQTRTTGLVTLPGAFIGALLGGASPVQAARFQIVVLAALLCAQAIVGVVVIRFLGAPRVQPGQLSSRARPTRTARALPGPAHRS